MLTVINAMLRQLANQRYVKLIAGASFTDTTTFKTILHYYLKTGICCVDVACDPEIITIAAKEIAKNNLQNTVGLMVSFPLDEDPHFRKIELDTQACIDCGLCEPVCPTQVFSMPNNQLTVEVDKCYGCSRCLPVCPTDALSLDAFSVMSHLENALKHPVVSAVEMHTKFADPAMITPLLKDIGPLLQDKLLSVCLQPQNHPIDQVEDFMMQLQSFSNLPVILQIDGKPMSATLNPDAGLPAVEAATNFYHRTKLKSLLLTLSGGINQHTANLIKDKPFIKGVGIGSAAKLSVLPFIETHSELAQKNADNLIQTFLHLTGEANTKETGKSPATTAIM